LIQLPDGINQKKARHLGETAGFVLVAGGRNHQNLRSQGNRGVAAASLRQLVSQFQMEACSGSHLDLLLSVAV
jgi:hypothetical protein